MAGLGESLRGRTTSPRWRGFLLPAGCNSHHRPSRRRADRVQFWCHSPAKSYNDDESGITEQCLIVRAGVVWSGVGTLAVALTMPHILGGRFRTSRCSATVQSREAFHALLSPSALGAVLQRCGTLSGGRPGGGSAPLPTSSLTQLGSRCLLRSPCGDARIYRRSHE